MSKIFVDTIEPKTANGNISMASFTGSTLQKSNIPSQVAFNAHRNSGGDISSGNTLVFNSTTVNIGNGFNTTTGKFTAPIAGIYFFATTCLSTSNSSSNDLQIRVDSTNIAQGRADVGSSAHNSVSVQVIATLTANQVVDVYIAGGNGFYGSSGQYNTFCGYLIGAAS